MRTDAELKVELMRIAEAAAAAGNHGMALLMVEASAAIERNKLEAVQ